MILEEIVNRPSQDPNERSVYADLCAIRLTCKFLSETAGAHLFRNVPFSVPFSTDPDDWALITAISRNPRLAASVRRVTYRTWIYSNDYASVENYALALLGLRQPNGIEGMGGQVVPANVTLPTILKAGKVSFAEASLRRGMESNKVKYQHQQGLLSQRQVEDDAPDLEILVHAFKMFPNLSEFSIANPALPFPDAEAWRKSQSDGSTDPAAPAEQWYITHPDDEQESVNMLPLSSYDGVYMRRRVCGCGYRDDVYDDTDWENFGAAFDQFAMAKFRGVQLFALASKRAEFRPLSVSVGFTEGAPLAISKSSTSAKIPMKPSFASLLQLKTILSSLVKLEFGIFSTTHQDENFVRCGVLGKALESAPLLQEIRIRNRYDMGHLATTISSKSCRRRQRPEDFMVPLASILGTSTFRDLHLLEINGVWTTMIDLLRFLSRHKTTLQTLFIAGLRNFGYYVDGEYGPEFDVERPHDEVPIGIGSLELGLTRLVVMLRDPYEEELQEPEHPVDSDDYRRKSVEGTLEIQKFLLSGGGLEWYD
jgi:hypothetical protein